MPVVPLELPRPRECGGPSSTQRVADRPLPRNCQRRCDCKHILPLGAVSTESGGATCVTQRTKISALSLCPRRREFAHMKRARICLRLTGETETIQPHNCWTLLVHMESSVKIERPQIGLKHTSTTSHPANDRYRSATSSSMLFACSRREP